jgi:S1-C subfamily serine protease
VSIEVPPGPDATPVPVAARTVTDFEGRFEIHGLSPGRRSLSVSARGYHRFLVTGLEVREDGALGPLEVELTPAAANEDPTLELTGIGAVLAPRREALVVVRVLPGGGAAEVGLSVGDAIVAIDGVAVADLGFTAAVERIRGEEGTTVRLTILRRDEEEEDVAVPRRRVRG